MQIVLYFSHMDFEKTEKQKKHITDVFYLH